MLETRNHFIEGVERLKNTLGREPSFHDGEIVSILLDRTPPSLTTIVELKKYARSPDDPGRAVVLAKYLVTLYFEKIEDLKLDDFNYQNVLQELVVTQEGPRLRVFFSSLFGAGFSFTCERAQLTDLTETPLAAS